MKSIKKNLNPTKNRTTERNDGFYPSILESIAEGIVVIGLDRKIIFINKMAKDLIGLNDEVTEGVKCGDIISTDLCSKNCPFDSSDINTSCSSYFMNINLYRRDMTEGPKSIPLCLNVAPLNDEKGRMIGIIENFRPMSEAIRAMEALRQSNVILSQEKDKVDSIIESLADGVFTIDRKLRITSFNKGMEALTGMKESEVVGSACADILSSDNCDGNCPLSQTLDRGYGIANVSERIATKSGGTAPVFISTAFLKDSNDDIELIATVRDSSEIDKLRKEINNRYQFSNIIAQSRKMQQIFELIETLSDTDCATLIEGESGTGKELVSRAIHHESDRRDKPFIKVNCSSIVEGLFESELFGHVRGAFSGAIKDKVGKFELADGGVIFLDEVADMPLSLQPKLLRVLQDMEFERVGDNSTRKVDVRVIAATNKSLKKEVKTGRFREDLFYRLCVVPIEMPPLRERKEDLPLLIDHFLEKCYIKMLNRPRISDVTPQALSALLDYNWPGNIRELKNAIEHAYIRTKTDKIDLESLPASITNAESRSDMEPIGPACIQNSIATVEKNHIEKLLKKYNGNRTMVAKQLGISRTTLWRRVKQENINVSRDH